MMSHFLLWGVWVISSRWTGHRERLRESKTIRSSHCQKAKSDHLSSQHILRAVACKILQKIDKKGHGHQLQKIRFWKFLSPKHKQTVPTQRGPQVKKWKRIHLLEPGEVRRARELDLRKRQLAQGLQHSYGTSRNDPLNKRTHCLLLQNGVLSYYYPTWERSEV